MGDILDDLPDVDLTQEAPEYGISKEEMEKFKSMLLAMSDEQKGRLLLSTVLDSVLVEIKEGMAGAATYNVARQLLKDNEIGIVPTRDNVAGKLQAALEKNSANANARNIVPAAELGQFDVADFLEKGVH